MGEYQIDVTREDAKPVEPHIAEINGSHYFVAHGVQVGAWGLVPNGGGEAEQIPVLAAQFVIDTDDDPLLIGVLMSVEGAEQVMGALAEGLAQIRSVTATLPDPT